MTVSNRGRLRGFVLALALAGGTASAAQAQDSTPTPATPEAAQEMAVEGLSKLLQALDLFVKSVPQYAAPEVLPNGDIIIRRVHPTPEQAPTPAPPKSDGDPSSI